MIQLLWTIAGIVWGSSLILTGIAAAIADVVLDCKTHKFVMKERAEKKEPFPGFENPGKEKTDD